MMTNGGGGQKSQKIDDVFYERPLTKYLPKPFGAEIHILCFIEIGEINVQKMWISVQNRSYKKQTLPEFDIILFCLTLSALIYWGSDVNRYFCIFSWEDIIKGGGGGGGDCCNKSSWLWLLGLLGLWLWLWSFVSIGSLWSTVPVDEVVDEAVEVDSDRLGKWLSSAHSSPKMASEIF